MTRQDQIIRSFAVGFVIGAAISIGAAVLLYPVAMYGASPMDAPMYALLVFLVFLGALIARIVWRECSTKLKNEEMRMHVNREVHDASWRLGNG